MTELVAWALERARHQTLTLVADLRQEQMCMQSASGENHPAWILGHLLVGDIYLLSLLKVQGLSDDFSDLLSKHGPGTTPIPVVGHYDSKQALVERLAHTGSLRLDAVRQMTTAELAQPTPDEVLAQTQPTMGHHLHALVFHEGHHGGQLSAWRKTQGLVPLRGAFAPKGY